MGTTKTALNAGPGTFVLVCAIEGWSELYTNADSTSAVATAWAGTGWSTVKGGLYVDAKIDQALDPDQPFVTMGTCTLTMMPQGAGTSDVLGCAIGKKTATYETYLDATLTNIATTITVKSTAGWPSSGYLHIGTECIAYTGTTTTTFTGCTRGAFSPFGSFENYFASDTVNSFGHRHRVGAAANSVNLQPIVSSSPRTWNGRRVGVWLHRVVGGVLDVKAEAELVFAGTIADWSEDANTGAVMFQVRPLTDIKDVAIGVSQWEGTSDGGFYVAAGATFYFADFDGTTVRDANELTCRASGASGANEFNEGYYNLGELCSVLSAWLASETTATNIEGSYTIASPVSSPDGSKTKIYWTLAGTNVVWALSMPPIVASFLGFDGITVTTPGHPENVSVGYTGPGFTNAIWSGGGTPMTLALPVDGGPSARAVFTTTTGEVQDQLATMPLGLSSVAAVGETWALFRIGDDRTFLAKYTDNSDGTVELEQIRPAFGYLIFAGVKVDDTPLKFPVDAGGLLAARQVYAIEGDPVTLIVGLLCSLGGSYNSPYTALPVNCSAGIPYELARSLAGNAAALPGMAGTMVLQIEKPTKLGELIGSDLMFRWLFLHWRDGEIAIGSWKAPSSAQAVESLDETNKAEPAGNRVNHKTVTTESTEWLRPVVKIRYNRDASDPKGDAYHNEREFVDAVAVDDAGGAVNTVTINLRNTYAEFSITGATVQSLLDDFLALMPMISRPARKVVRSIDSRYFLRLGLGDVVLLSDDFARDPETGLRGLTDRPAMVTKESYSLGGWTDGSGSVQPAGGEVHLLFSDHNPDRLGAAYVPSAAINDLYSVASFDHGYLASGPTIRVLTNRYTETSEVSDARYFAEGDKILIIERDPLDPTAPVKWERTIATGGVQGDQITLTAALSSPAWDNTKRYHVIAQDYAAATTTQRLDVFQADAVDGLIVDTTGPFLYGSGSADATYTSNADMATRYPLSYTDAIELPPSSRYADGAARDVAHEQAVARLLDNTIDYTRAHHFAMLGTERSNTTYSGRQLCFYFPMFLSTEIPSNSLLRYLTLALWARSTDGTSTSARITLSRERPSFSTIEDVAWSGTFAQVEWTGITSTTGTTLSDKTIASNVKDPVSGELWIAIELGLKCACRGLAKGIEGPRQAPL